ncbi:MAG TPA: ROK family protein [Anaerolineaceae bacterium]|nr:ROK family protein [Anaerolineaceae bacterium]
MDAYGGIEAGGTKFVCALAIEPNQIVAETRFATTQPAETIRRVIDFFRTQAESGSYNLRAIGVGSFGPVDLNPESPAFGSITTTPKPGWANTPLVGPLQAAFNVPVALDTDVNAAAIGEGAWGAARDLNNYVYLTIGTGIGGGAVTGRQPVHGLVHPEIGHMLIPHNLQHDPFPGSCPFHGDCFEGLANGPAIERRWGQKGELLPPDHPAWELEAEYIAAALHTVICTLSPQRIILGGGVMQQMQLFPAIRRLTRESLNGYIHSPAILEETDQYIVPPGLGSRSGVLGAIALAQEIVQQPSWRPNQ